MSSLDKRVSVLEGAVAGPGGPDPADVARYDAVVERLSDGALDEMLREAGARAGRCSEGGMTGRSSYELSALILEYCGGLAGALANLEAYLGPYASEVAAIVEELDAG